MDKEEAVQIVKQFRQKWSHKPTPIPLDAHGLWYSEECVDQMMAEFAVSQQMKITELTQALEEIHKVICHHKWNFEVEARRLIVAALDKGKAVTP